MIRAIIVDDEKFAIANLKRILAEEAPHLNIVAEAGDVDTACNAIKQYKPDVLFLDIELSDGTGFDVVNRCTSYTGKIIFVTAFDQYALQAIKKDAFDYILKPLDRKEIQLCIEKLRIALSKTNEVAHLLVNDSEGQYIIEIPSICYCESESRYTYVHLNTGKRLMVSKNLGEIEKQLQQYSFLRIHHQYLVNTDHIQSYISGRGGILVMKNGTQLPVAVRKKDDLLHWLKNRNEA